MAFRSTPPHPSALLFDEEAVANNARAGISSILARTSLGDPHVVTARDIDRGYAYPELEIGTGDHVCIAKVLRHSFAQGRFATISTIAIPTNDPNKFRVAAAKIPRSVENYTEEDLYALEAGTKPPLMTLENRLRRQAGIARQVFESEKKAVRGLLLDIEAERRIQANSEEDIYYRMMHGDHAYAHHMAHPLMVGEGAIVYEMIGDIRDILDNIEDPDIAINTTLQQIYITDLENFSRQELLTTMLQVAQFLAWLDRHKRMYNDLQPSNVIVSNGGRVVDFDSVVHYDDPYNADDLFVASIDISDHRLISEARKKHEFLDVPNKVAFGNFLAEGLTKKSLNKGEEKGETVLWRLAHDLQDAYFHRSPQDGGGEQNPQYHSWNDIVSILSGGRKFIALRQNILLPKKPQK